MKEQFRQKRESSGAVGHSKDIPGCKTLNVKSAGLQSEVCNPRSETDDLKRWPAGAGDTNRTIRQGEVETVIHETHPGGRGNTPKEAEQQYREFFEAMNKGTVTMTAKGLILCCNQRFA
jgi:hypothetical protein